jgi:predicted alpha/beta superfamily hydrolase
MKKIIILITSLLLIISCKENKPQQQGEDDLIVIGQIDSIRSAVLDETRTIWVHVPGDPDNPTYSQVQYPVIYLLDGPGHFYPVTGMIRQMSDNTICPKMIVVGISNTDRTRDMTPTHAETAFGDSALAANSGGGDKFLDFMEKELVPYIEKKYPATGYKTYVGHSYGGIAVLNALFTRPGLFNNYIAIDPSLWWDDQVLLPIADSVLGQNNYEGKSLYIAVANTVEEGSDLNNIENDTSEYSVHIRSILQFIRSTEKKTDNGLQFNWKYYAEDDHGSVPLIAEYDALRFLFSWYRLKGLEKFYWPDSKETSEELIRIITSHYKHVSSHFGYQALPPEDMINSMGYNFLTRKPEYSCALFKLNIDNYPDSPNVYDSMGDYYLSQTDTANAIKYFSKAVESGNTTYSKDKLEKLQNRTQ